MHIPVPSGEVRAPEEGPEMEELQERHPSPRRRLFITKTQKDFQLRASLTFHFYTVVKHT